MELVAYLDSEHQILGAWRSLNLKANIIGKGIIQLITMVAISKTDEYMEEVKFNYDYTRNSTSAYINLSSN